MRDVVEARAELYRLAAEKEANLPEVEDSITEPSIPPEEGHEEGGFLIVN